MIKLTGSITQGFIIIIVLILGLLLYGLMCTYLILRSIRLERHGDRGITRFRRWNTAEVHEWGYGATRFGDPSMPYMDDIDIEGPREYSEDERSRDARPDS